MNNTYTRLFSIIIPTWNYGHYLARAIESVLAQQGDDYELIVVDDGSTDLTAEIVRSYESGSNPIRYVHQENRGPAASRNRGVDVSCGQYLLFLDADDALLPRALPAFRAVLKASCEVDFVRAGWKRVSSKGRVQDVPGKPAPSGKEEAFISYMRGISPLEPGSAIFHRRIFNRLKFPEALRSTEDRAFYAHVLALYSGPSIAELVVTIHRHRSSLSHNVELSKCNWPKALDLVFDPLILPQHFMAYRDECAAIMHIAFFHRLYNSREFRAALEHFKKAVKVSIKYCLGWRPIRRYLKARLEVLREDRQLAKSQQFK
ncbi:glycosyltransferase family 2 protein [Petrachloros mirabilis]